MKTEQEKAWKGSFGDVYHERNSIMDAIKLSAFFDKALLCVDSADVSSVLEYGAGDGRNLRALSAFRMGLLGAAFSGVELNARAFAKLQASVPGTHYQRSVLDPHPTEADLVVTKGLLIHIAPEELEQAYRVLLNSTKRYLLICEYFSPRHEPIAYRSENMCWKGDFAGGLMRMSDLALVDYGFVYSRDPLYDEDDVSWFLLEKPDAEEEILF